MRRIPGLHIHIKRPYLFIYISLTTSIAEEDYDAFCLAYMFTYRDFEGGTLGLAWTGDLKNAGGVCEKNGVSRVSRVTVVVHKTENIYIHLTSKSKRKSHKKSFLVL